MDSRRKKRNFSVQDEPQDLDEAEEKLRAEKAKNLVMHKLPESKHAFPREREKDDWEQVGINYNIRK